MPAIINASPQMITLGTYDGSTRVVTPEPVEVPQHLPKFFLKTQKGPLTPQLVSGSEMLARYGATSFEKTSKYFNHASLFASKVVSAANNIIVQRVETPNSMPLANVTLWLDVIADMVPNYVRDVNGLITTDTNGDPVVDAITPTIPGYRYKTLSSHDDGGGVISSDGFTLVGSDGVTLIPYVPITGTMDVTADDTVAIAIGGTISFATPTAFLVGDSVTLTGSAANDGTYVIETVAADNLSVTLVDGATLFTAADATANMTLGKVSTLYPIMSIGAKYPGEYYNNIGFTLSPAGVDDIPTGVLDNGGGMPYIFGLVDRADAGSSARKVRNKYGVSNIVFTFEDNIMNPLTESSISLDDQFPQLWENETDPKAPLLFSDYLNPYIYNDNIDILFEMFGTSEHDFMVDSSIPVTQYDWVYEANGTLGARGKHMMNLFTNKSTKGVDYRTVFVDSEDVDISTGFTKVEFALETAVWLAAGTDGDLSDTAYEAKVVEYMADYLDPDSKVMDMATNVESMFYDSGFSLDTKKELCNAIAKRKDTFVALTTHVDGEDPLTLDEERSVATVLRTRLQLTPESDYFGTKVMRGIVVGGNGLLSDDSIKGRVPALLEIAVKSATYMGAANGKWKPGFAFDRSPNNTLNILKDISPAFIPSGVKPLLWTAGLVWAQNKNRREFFFPAIQTVYENDTSVLNSYFTAFAVTQLNKVAFEAWTEFTGVSDMTQDQLADAVVGFVKNRLLGRFDGRFTFVPEVVFSAADEARGYSWTLVTKIYAGNMKTVMVSRVEAYRFSDLG